MKIGVGVGVRGCGYNITLLIIQDSKYRVFVERYQQFVWIFIIRGRG